MSNAQIIESSFPCNNYMRHQLARESQVKMENYMSFGIHYTNYHFDDGSSIEVARNS